MDPSHPNWGMLGLVGAGVLASFWIVFKVAWKIVKIGFFILSFCIGFAVCGGLSLATGHPQPIWALGAEALAFAWGFSLVRSKVAKVVTGIAVVAMAQFIGMKGFDVTKVADISKMPIPFTQAPAPAKPPVKPPEKPAPATHTAASTAKSKAHKKAKPKKKPIKKPIKKPSTTTTNSGTK